MAGHSPRGVRNIQARYWAYKEEIVNDKLNKAEPRADTLTDQEKKMKCCGVPRAATVQSRISHPCQILEVRGEEEIDVQGKKVGEEDGGGHGRGNHAQTLKPPRQGSALRLEKMTHKAPESPACT
ncbi:hypothetical protein N1851_019530 [Merluccius polli]|uniref:Uncharacterized protein n=1 Tax=Merluccius polli TaxID=89951 RepID=A0AA47MLL2_MERPO|nr:hypothetical protein N1851_019530 [Merluccius polli]